MLSAWHWLVKLVWSHRLDSTFHFYLSFSPPLPPEKCNDLSELGKIVSSAELIRECVNRLWKGIGSVFLKVLPGHFVAENSSKGRCCLFTSLALVHHQAFMLHPGPSAVLCFVPLQNCQRQVCDCPFLICCRCYEWSAFDGSGSVLSGQKHTCVWGPPCNDVIAFPWWCVVWLLMLLNGQLQLNSSNLLFGHFMECPGLERTRKDHWVQLLL